MCLYSIAVFVRVQKKREKNCFDNFYLRYIRLMIMLAFGMWITKGGGHFHKIVYNS